MKIYIFGYGSLIELESRTRTTSAAAEAYPVLIRGYERGWYARIGVPGLTTTFLGCRYTGSEEDSVTGVVYEITEEDLPALDRREANYQRTEVTAGAIESLSSFDVADGKLFVYTNKLTDEEATAAQPDQQFPIVQSYVDICLNGCIQIEEAFPQAMDFGFTAHFIRTTKKWNAWWANDRIYPRRPFIHTANAYKIDALLQAHLTDPSLFGKIYIE